MENEFIRNLFKALNENIWIVFEYGTLAHKCHTVNLS